jgi:uncharacterized OB-fold protein
VSAYLRPGLPAPVPQPDALDTAFWEGLGEERLLLQRCNACEGWQWGPEWCCHRCHSFDLRYEETPAEGTIYSHERVWHPVHPALAEQGPYVIVLIGDPQQPLVIGAPVLGVFEHHPDADVPHTLLHWAVA